ncbi:MAG: hypothetical protein RL464_306 [Actinomycetota bacterium]
MTFDEQLLQLAEDIAFKAGDLLMKRPSNFELDQKSGVLDFATQMDHESEKLIVEAILNSRVSVSQLKMMREGSSE